MFTLLPLLTGLGQERHGQILTEAAELADAGQLVPLLNERVFSIDDLDDAHAAVAAGATGKNRRRYLGRRAQAGRSTIRFVPSRRTL